MKPRHVESARVNARYTLIGWGVRKGSSFDTLKKTHIEKVLKDANRERFLTNEKDPIKRARAYFERTQNRAKSD